jgi:predicted adenylyl cyclase CyaB
VEIAAGEPLEQALTAALGTWIVVRKRREVFLHYNVRIHLDEVESLGSFLEFEAVLGPDADAALSQNRLDFLTREFGLTDETLLDRSYSDLLAAKRS